MMKHEDMITLIGNMFTDTYVAGARNDLVSFLDAKAQRENLYAAVTDLYAELEMESYYREQLQVELDRALHKLEGLQRDYDHMREIKDRLLLLKRESDELKEAKLNMGAVYGDAVMNPTAEVKVMEAFAKYATIPDDGGKFSEQDLPFPEVEGGDSDV